MTTESKPKTASEILDDAEEQMLDELNVRVAKSVLFQYGEMDPSRPGMKFPKGSSNPKDLALQGDDPRLQKMPEKPTLLDFFKYRWGYSAHLLQSATHALKAGCDEETILACLLHD